MVKLDKLSECARGQVLKDAMEAVLKPGGTANRIGAGLQYRMAGKTGTAQVVQIKQGAKYNAAALAEQHRDHSWFIAFAPVEQPKIAVAVIVENGGWGAAAAAPLARNVMDFYLLGKRIEPEEAAAQTAAAKPKKKPSKPTATSTQNTTSQPSGEGQSDERTSD